MFQATFEEKDYLKNTPRDHLGLWSRKINWELQPKTVQGCVTQVNEHMGYFVIDNKYRVYPPYDKHFIHLPQVSLEIEVCQAKQTFCVLMLDSEMQLKHSQPLVEYVRKIVIPEELNWENEFFWIDYVGVVLRDFVRQEVMPECFKWFYRILPKMSRKKVKSIEQVDIKTPKFLKFSDDNSAIHNNIDYDGDILMSVNRNDVKKTARTYLVGILISCKDTGQMTLKDDTGTIIVKVTPPDKNFLKKVNNSLVIVRNYVVFSEIFRDCQYETVRYVLFSQKDVVVVSRNYLNLTVPLYETGILDKTIGYNVETIRISEVVWGYKKEPEVWMDVLIKPETEPQSETIRAFLAVPQPLLHVVPFLKENCTYIVGVDQALVSEHVSSHKELFAFREVTSKKIFRLPPSTVFQESTATPQRGAPLVYTDFWEVVRKVQSARYESFSFMLTISKKELGKKPFQSWYPTRHKGVPFFGDVGDKQQRVYFRQGETFLDMYLVNRENFFYATGLVGDMKIRVNNAIIHKKYLKSNMFTSFEVVDYQPKLRFSCENIRTDTSHPYYWYNNPRCCILGLFEFLPPVIIRGVVVLRAVRDLSLCIRKEPLKDWKGNDAGVLDMLMSIHVADGCNGCFSMEVRNVNFLYDMLGLERSKTAFIDFMDKIGGLSMDMLKVSAKETPHNLTDKLLQLLRKQNYTLESILDVTCIRQFRFQCKPWRILAWDFLQDSNHYKHSFDRVRPEIRKLYGRI